MQLVLAGYGVPSVQAHANVVESVYVQVLLPTTHTGSLHCGAAVHTVAAFFAVRVAHPCVALHVKVEQMSVWLHPSGGFTTHPPTALLLHDHVLHASFLKEQSSVVAEQ